MSNKLQFTSSVGKTSPKRLGLVLQFFLTLFIIWENGLNFQEKLDTVPILITIVFILTILFRIG